MKETRRRGELTGGEVRDLAPACHTHPTARPSPGSARLGLRLPFTQRAFMVNLIPVIVVFPSVPASVRNNQTSGENNDNNVRFSEGSIGN